MIEALRLRALDALQPVVKEVGKVHVPFTHKLIHSYHYRAIVEKLEPGVVFVTRIRGELSNVFIPGFYTHAAIFTGERNVTEAIGQGVVEKDLLDFLFSKDYVAMLKPRFCDEVGMLDAANWAKKQVGLPYDYDFTAGNKAFYCSELVWASYDQVCPKNPFEKRFTLGVCTVTPQDYVSAEKHWEVVYDSRSQDRLLEAQTK